ncbi:cytochrome c [Pusillimonas sp. ANT_WB101]|uniref:SorU family sulfite dehydrogenase c-type cytochrome subunit n=1 Tax=Pusillimonas sp. ANT_WB101 TaxID=2597356 RepID=UPI0021060C20|nr:cytochrome c [Pusillimonas sp. ANT_WB101]
MNQSVKKYVVMAGSTSARRVVAMSLAAVALAVAPCVGSASDIDEAKLEQGKALFMKDAVPACAVCHTLKDAGSAGAIGPNLDDLKPSYSHVKDMVTQGAGIMPSFGESLTDEQIEAVAAYVSHVTGGDPS